MKNQNFMFIYFLIILINNLNCVKYKFSEQIFGGVRKKQYLCRGNFYKT